MTRDTPTFDNLHHQVHEQIRTNPVLAAQPDFVFHDPRHVVELLPKVEQPLAMWLFGQWDALVHVSRLTGRLKPDSMTPAQALVAKECAQHMVIAESRDHAWSDLVSKIQVLSTPIDLIKEAATSAPTQELAFYFHGIITVRQAIATMT